MSVKVTNNPYKSTNGQLPILRFSNQTFCSVDKILDVFRQHKFSPDNEITKLQSAEVTAYITMLDECIHPAIQYLWLDIFSKKIIH